jgi:hypothetical protein
VFKENGENKMLHIVCLPEDPELWNSVRVELDKNNKLYQLKKRVKCIANYCEVHKDVPFGKYLGFAITIFLISCFAYYSYVSWIYPKFIAHGRPNKSKAWKDTNRKHYKNPGQKPRNVKQNQATYVTQPRNNLEEYKAELAAIQKVYSQMTRLSEYGDGNDWHTGNNRLMDQYEDKMEWLMERIAHHSSTGEPLPRIRTPTSDELKKLEEKKPAEIVPSQEKPKPSPKPQVQEIDAQAFTNDTLSKRRVPGMNNVYVEGETQGRGGIFKSSKSKTGKVLITCKHVLGNKKEITLRHVVIQNDNGKNKAYTKSITQPVRVIAEEHDNVTLEIDGDFRINTLPFIPKEQIPDNQMAMANMNGLQTFRVTSEGKLASGRKHINFIGKPGQSGTSVVMTDAQGKSPRAILGNYAGLDRHKQKGVVNCYSEKFLLDSGLNLFAKNL